MFSVIIVRTHRTTLLEEVRFRHTLADGQNSDHTPRLRQTRMEGMDSEKGRGFKRGGHM